MKTLTYILILLGSVYTLNNCNRKCDEVITVNLKDLHKYVPYTGTEVLRFLHNNTDTQTFVGQGMERFYVAYRKQEDGACREDHESVRIRFVNPKTQDEIKMEYVYDQDNFSVGHSFYNNYTYYKFYLNNNRYGTTLRNVDLAYSKIFVNQKEYNYVHLFHDHTENNFYFAYRRPVDANYSGVIKIKTLNDTLEIIQ